MHSFLTDLIFGETNITGKPSRYRLKELKLRTSMLEMDGQALLNTPLFRFIEAWTGRHGSVCHARSRTPNAGRGRTNTKKKKRLNRGLYIPIPAGQHSTLTPFDSLAKPSTQTKPNAASATPLKRVQASELRLCNAETETHPDSPASIRLSHP
jgi:hypothetical protein